MSSTLVIFIVAGGVSDADICLLLFATDKTKVLQASSDLKTEFCGTKEYVDHLLVSY